MPDLPLIGGDPLFTSKDVVEIKMSLTRIEERTAASAEAAEHRHANIKQAMEAFVPRRELDQSFTAIGARISGLVEEIKEKAEAAEVDRRLGKVEDNQTWVIRTILGFVASGILAAVVYATKHGGAP